jgi:eukaryotic-like serine/threonine-protein kinase
VAPSSDQSEERTLATRCRRCGQTFAAEAGFCPFDGAALVLASDWDKALDPLLGSVVDQRYEVEALIGEGGMGSVYRVRQRPLGRAFAMKALRRDLADDPEIRRRFLREARTAASVSHPGVVRIKGFGYLPDRRPFFVMELLEGLPLRWLLRSGRLTTARAATIARRIAEALAAAHDAGIVHRDLKPDNVHIAAGDAVKVMDFGLAVTVGDGQRPNRSSIAFGTPHYMSPEQAMGEEVDGRTDVYALGVVLYEMLTGRVPFDAATCAEVLGQQQFAAPIPPTELLGDASELVAGIRPENPSELGKLERVVLICLAKEAKDRFHSLRDLAAALAVAVPASLAAEPAPPDSRR